MHVLRSRCAQAQLSSLTAHASAHKLQAGLALVLDGLAAQREARGAAQRGLAHSCVVCGLSRRALCRHDALGFEKHDWAKSMDFDESCLLAACGHSP